MLNNLKEIISEVLQSIIPLVFVVVTIMLVLPGTAPELFFRFIAGTMLIAGGLFLFLVGVRVGLLPIGETIGAELVSKGSLLFLLTASFLFGVVITIAEPDVRVLAYQVYLAGGGSIDNNLLILSVAVGLGVWVSMGILRILLGIPIAYLLTAGYLVIIVLSFFTPQGFVAISFDAGGVTTGPMAAPFILALGVGATAVLGGKSKVSDTFGLIGLASIGPVISVMLLGVFFG